MERTDVGEPPQIATPLWKPGAFFAGAPRSPSSHGPPLFVSQKNLRARLASDPSIIEDFLSEADFLFEGSDARAGVLVTGRTCQVPYVLPGLAEKSQPARGRADWGRGPTGTGKPCGFLYLWGSVPCGTPIGRRYKILTFKGCAAKNAPGFHTGVAI